MASEFLEKQRGRISSFLDQELARPVGEAYLRLKNQAVGYLGMGKETMARVERGVKGWKRAVMLTGAVGAMVVAAYELSPYYTEFFGPEGPIASLTGGYFGLASETAPATTAPAEMVEVLTPSPIPPTLTPFPTTAIFTLTEEDTETPTAIPELAWEALAGGDNLVATGQWHRVEGVAILADGQLEIRGDGGAAGWNTPINPWLKLKADGDFAIMTQMQVNPETTYAGLEIFEAQPPQGPGVEWFNTKRLAVELRDGGSGLWIGFWDGSRDQAATLGEMTGLAGDAGQPHQLEVRFLLSQGRLRVTVDGQSQTFPLPTALLEDDNELRLGFNASPEAILTVSELRVTVPDGGGDNLRIESLTAPLPATPEPGVVQPIPTGEAAATAPAATPGSGEIQPPAGETLDNPFAASASECLQLEDWGYKWHCFTGGSRSQEIESTYPGMVVYVYKAVPGGVAEFLGKTDLNGLNNFSLTNPNYDYGVWDTGQIALVVNDWPADTEIPNKP